MLAHVDLQDWVGRTQTLTAQISSKDAAAIAATLGGSAPRAGDPLPGLWHWCADLPTVPMSDLGTDGHPELGGFLPPVRLPRRMWAGGALKFMAPMVVGQDFERTSIIKSVTQKSGSTGDMVFVTVHHTVFQNDVQIMEETQDIVYLAMPTEFRAPKKIPPMAAPDITADVAVSTPLLFRYSAITFNAHRIHYDLPYAQQVEKYPGLVVHGPLQAMKLMMLATGARGRMPDHFKFRGIHPMFHTDDFQAQGTWADDQTLNLCTAVLGSHQGMTAQAVWED